MKIHCSSLEPKIPTTTLPSTSSSLSSPGPKDYRGEQSDLSGKEGSSDSEEADMDLDTVDTVDTVDTTDTEPQLTRLECVNPHEELSKVADLRLPLRPTDLVCSLLDSGVQEFSSNLSSVQLSPAGSDSPHPLQPPSSLTGPAPTPPSSDLEDFPVSIPASVSYYSLSPPDLLSPPLSTSDPCLSPGASLSPALSPPHTGQSPAAAQSFATTDNEAMMTKSDSMKHKTEQSDCQTPALTAPSQQHNHVNTDIDNNNENLNNQHSEEEPLSFLSSSSYPCSNQPGAHCINCSQKNCSCNKQSKLKQLFYPQPEQLSSFDSKQSINSFHQDENFMKLIEKQADKNSKESLKTEPKELISNAAMRELTSSVSSAPARPLTSSCALPSDIPTLESLSRTSPKLSTWRQTRIISEKLEQHLWTWRCACKKSGKRISKSLLQARAKWAFRKAGIVEFKVIRKVLLVGI